MHHTNKENVRFADLTDLELSKLREAEKTLNTQSDRSNPNEEIILLAYKQQPQAHR